MRMATKPKMYRLDEEVVEAFERMCESKKERPTAVIQRLMLEAAKRAGFWKAKGEQK